MTVAVVIPCGCSDVATGVFPRRWGRGEIRCRESNARRMKKWLDTSRFDYMMRRTQDTAYVASRSEADRRTTRHRVRSSLARTIRLTSGPLSKRPRFRMPLHSFAPVFSHTSGVS